MSEDTQLTRRQLLRASIAAASVVPLGSTYAAQAAEETYKWVWADVTPSVVLGPFYPVVNKKPIGRDADLTLIRGRSAPARGQVLYVMGQVFNIKGKPVKGVEVELWQANAAGRYTHPSDPNPAPLDPNFQGYGVAMTDLDGRYRFKTIRPGGYPVTAGWDRPPHIHFQLTGRIDRLATQMWFPGDPQNGQDRLFNVLPRSVQQRLTAKIESPMANMEPDSKVAVFNIILANG